MSFPCSLAASLYRTSTGERRRSRTTTTTLAVRLCQMLHHACIENKSDAITVIRSVLTVETESSSVGSSANSDSGLEDELDEDLDEEFERSLSSFRAEDESLSERLYALKDMVSPSTRRRIVSTWNTSTSWAAWGGKAAGNAIWIATTSALLVGLPLALAIENETMMVQQEKEILAQQQGAQQVSILSPLVSTFPPAAR